ncbi:hypothetical protein [Actinomadura sp. NPDC048394]|uniref:hypothetical protein n=1 Tax=Actinomadura sp. NPDC048394 TaxID=3158223 RepID=UPI0033E19034
MPTSYKPRTSSRPGASSQPGPGSPGRHKTRPALQPVTVTRTSVAWPGMWAVAVISAVFMVVVVSNTGDVRISFADMSGVLPLAVVLLAAMAAGVAVTLVLGTARLTQLRPLTRKRLR